MVFNLFLVLLPLLLDQTHLQPLLEGLVALFLFNLFSQSLLFLDAELLLFLESLGDKLALLPLVHGVGPLLVLFVQSCLLQDHLFVQIFFGLEDKHLAKAFLVLFDPQPLLVVNLCLGNFELILGVHIEDRLVDGSHLGLIMVRKVHLRLTVSIDVGLGCLVEAFEQLFVRDVLPLLVIEVTFILIVLIISFTVVLAFICGL